MRSRLSYWPVLLPLLWSACMPMEEARISQTAVKPSQRTVLIVYPAPSPWVIPDTDSKAESAAKVLPGLSFVVSAYQEERSLQESKDLKQYLPRWSPERKLLPFLLSELPKSGYSGVFLSTSQAEVPEERLRQFNRASDVLGWQKAYYYEDEGRVLARNYGSLLTLDDALIMEVNLMYGVNGNDDGNMVPVLSASSRLLHANTLRVIWRHEDAVEDLPAARSLYEFKTLPQQLVDDWEKLMPALAIKIAASLRASMDAPVPYTTPTPGPSPVPDTTPLSPPPIVPVVVVSSPAWQGVTPSTAPSSENMDTPRSTTTSPSPAPVAPSSSTTPSNP